MFLNEKRKKEIEEIIWTSETGSDLLDVYRYAIAAGYREGVRDCLQDHKNELAEKHIGNFEPCK